MWLINTTSPEQRRGIAEFFATIAATLAKRGGGAA